MSFRLLRRQHTDRLDNEMMGPAGFLIY